MTQADPSDLRCSPEENCLPKWILPSVEADDFAIIDDFGINLKVERRSNAAHPSRIFDILVSGYRVSRMTYSVKGTHLMMQ